MTHPSFQTNGASLEDCHTNFFALTELSGIKWRKLTWSEPGGGSHGPGHGNHHTVPGEPLEDPVLRSYARCLAADILCVWRRVSSTSGPVRPPADAFEPPPPPAQPPPLSLASAKELWIFWYGEEPDLNELVAPELNMTDCEQGSWESGLSYECRSLLFKALHNLIERCLLSRDFIRLGKWFVQPYDYPAPRFDPSDPDSPINNPGGPSPPYDAYTAPPTAGHLSFSFAFFVHGESSVCASVDVRQHPPVRRLMRWHLQEAQASNGGLKVILAPFGLAGTLTGQSFRSPESTAKFLDDWSHFYPLDKSSSLTDSSVVEVIVGGVKMRYPSCYVLVTDLDDNANQTLTGMGNVPSTVPILNERLTKSSTPNGTCSPITVPTPPPSPIQVNSRVPQPGPHTVTVENINSMWREQSAAQILPERTWQYCLCGGGADKGGKEDGNWDFIEPTRKASCTCLKSCLGGSYTPQGGPPSYPRTQESMTVNSVGSPASVAPSPLQGPHSQPASVPPGDATMPTLSPNPPISDQSPSVGGDKSHTPPDSVRLPPKSVESPTNSPSGGKCDQESKVGDRRAAEDPEKSNGELVPLKRPMLLSKEYEVALGEEEHTLDMLYDYSTQDAWLNHPVKRFKPDDKENRLNKKVDLYTMYHHNGISQCNDISNVTIVKQEIKQEPGLNAETEETKPTLQPHPHGVKRPGDPYEFEEDGTNPNCKIDGFTRTPPIKEEPKDKKDLFTSEGLQPSYKDLDQIFDNSDYTSSDEACFPQIQIQTPPGSAGPTPNHLHHDDTPTTKRLSSGHGQTNLGGCPNVGMPPELSKMFPTPPSLEHNPIASPCGQLDLGQQDYPDLTIVRIKQEIYPNMGSPQEENIEDWSFVFKPPTICKMVGSSKYAPLNNLPSQLQPIQMPGNCVYKPSWVQHMENSKNHSQQNVNNNNNTSNMNSNRNRTPTPSVPNNVHQNAGIFPPSPLHPPGFRPPPPPYELPSPANSTTSSYLNKNLNSVEPVPTPQANQRTPEASSLVLNILLTDTAFNIFRDHNFDSCTLCVCNAGGKVVGNIRGADAGIYLLNSHSDKVHASAQPTSPYPGLGQPPPYGGMLSPQQHHGSIDEDQIRCSCGFSAVVNRRLAYGSGLFYEDELEITGIAEDPGERKKPSLISFLASLNCLKQEAATDRELLDSLPHNLLELIRDQLVFVPSTANVLCRAARYVKQAKVGVFSNAIHFLEYSDSNEVTGIALDQSKNLLENLSMCKMENEKMSKSGNSIGVHRWPFLRAPGPQCNQDIVRVMKALQPLLQDAIQKKCQTRLWEAPSAVKGPLTWRQFHRLAGRGTDDRCEPQPIPSVIVGHDKDWLCLSPYALQQWESLLLEPYSYSRDVAYIVVAPDNDAVLPRIKTYFKELSTAYEICKLGRHSPITKVLRDGILRVGKTAKQKIGNEPVEEWFTLLGDGETSEMLKLYAQVCKHHLAPHLQQVPMDKTLLDPPSDSNERPAPSPMPPPSTPDPNNSSQSSSMSDKAPSTPKSDQDGDGLKDSSFNSCNMDTSHEDDEREAPSVVVYLVEPFTLGSDQPELQRLAVLALLRCFQSVLAAVPENIRSNISVQIISLESIVELNKARDRMRHSDHMRALALNIFSQCRRLLIHSNNVKSLTGFGTAAASDLFMKNKDEKNKAPYKLFTPPYILAPMREKVEAAEGFGKGTQDQASVLYISYCLSEDQSWLLAVCTDERGEIFESITINIDIPNRSRRKKASARRIGLEKLMTFILGVMSQSVRPWRLVVGRLGRIGHGELKGWSWLLSKKNLLKASRHLKEICNQCSMMYPSAVPCILSACLVSLEPDSCLRLMPDQFTPDERFSQASVNSQLSTPQDVSCTHILVFPTSATTQSSQTAFQEQHIGGDLNDEEFFRPFDDDMTEGIDNEFNDIFNWDQIGCQSPPGSPRREDAGAGSPGGGVVGGMEGAPGALGGAAKGQEPSEEVGVVLQQPLALGYIVSTAPTGRMPRWFWASCPHLEGVCPAFLKNALHLHSPNVQNSSDDLFQQSSQVTSHPLDSQYTTDVLRYVLEGYNALSWLAMDSNTKDRLSCLPIHMQNLVQLYHTASALL